VLRRPPDGFVNVTDGSSLTEPQKVDNYEIGIKGEWSNVQASVSAFYNTSDLGADFAVVDNFLETIRAPQRVYGVEAAIDVQPSPKWKLGGTLTWLEGENDPEDDGSFVALNSITVPPLKLTGYVENQTTPGWSNRLQFLLSGSRERAFNDEIDSAPIDSFFTVDYLSRIKIGQGELQIGVQNLFNSQYFPVYSQYFAPFFDSSNYAGRGRSLSVGYRLTW
jgi:iron complex outermembrane recepter protein